MFVRKSGSSNVVVLGHATCDIVGGADVEPAVAVLKNVGPVQTRQVGLESTTSRLIPTGRDSTIESLPKNSIR